MHKITFFSSYKGLIKFISVIALIFSSLLVYGQNPLPTIVPNANRGLPFIYALPDNGNDLFSVAPDPTSDPLPNPSIVSTDRTFNGEGSGFRSSNRKVYAFADRHDLYEVDPITGNSTLMINNMFPGVVQGVEFYINNVTGDEVMFIITDPTGDGNGGSKLFAFNPNNNWLIYDGYPKTLFGATKLADGLAWNPVDGVFYIQHDDDVDFFSLNITTGETVFAFSTNNSIDGEGIGFAADGKLYIEDEGSNRRIYQVDLSNGNLTAAALLGGSSDVEGIMGNSGVRDDGGDSPNSYGWAAHQLPILNSTPVSVYLGAVPPDSEDPFLTFGNGFGDDFSGIDDEDGVKIGTNDLDNQVLVPGETYTLRIETNGSGFLNAWIDWNGDGVFDTDEQVADEVVPSGNNINLNITVPSNAAMGVTYARFRYSSENNLTASYSEALDGEVEDYRININVNTEISLIKTGVFDDNNNNGIADVGELIHYSFSVKNTGDMVLTDITIDDPLIDVSGSLASLNPNEVNNSSFTADYPITQADIINGFVENQATATACYDTVVVDPAGNCSGKVTYLKLEYQGTVGNAHIEVIEFDGQTIFDDVVHPGEQFEFFGMDTSGGIPTMGPQIEIFINGMFNQNIHTSCSQPIGIGSVFGDFEVINGASKNGGPFVAITGNGCIGEVTDLSDDDNYTQNDPTVVPLPVAMPTPRECGCAPFYDDSNFVNPTLITGSALQVGAVYRFANVFPNNIHGTTIDALIKIEEFENGATLLDIDVTSSGLQEAFQPRINSTNGNNQSVLFSITFVSGGGNYGDEQVISFFGTPLDIDGDGQSTREYGEISLPDAYFINNNTLLNIVQTSNFVRGTATGLFTAPGDEVSLDPRFTFSNYFENKSSFTYRIGKIDGNSDRYYSLDMDSIIYNDPNSVLITYPVICGNVSDEGGDPLVGVEIDVTGSDGSSVTVQTDGQGNYKAVAAIPDALVNVTYEIRENDPPGYISISDVDGANDNLITRVINLMSTCGNDFVDGFDSPDGWNFVCGDDKVVDEYGFNSNCFTTTFADIPNPDNNMFQYVVEIVYKGNNPGQTIEFTDSSGTTHTLIRSVPVGGSSNIWVYRGEFSGSTDSVTYVTTDTLKCKLQSLVVYAFRNVPGASSSSGVFTGRSGYNDIQTIDITIPAFTQARDLIIETPISELTDDGRYLLLRAESGGVSEEIFIYGPDTTLPGGTCCLAIPSLTLNAVPGTATLVTLTIDSRNNQNGQTVNGQSWVIASGVNVDGDCDINTTFAIDDINNTFVNTPVDGNVLTNDFDLEGDTQTVTTTTVTTVQGVVVTIDPVTGAYTYTPPTDYVGEDSFEYTICDDGTVQACDSATVYIEVFPISSNNPPVANADTNTTQVDTPVNGFVLPNDFDPDGDPIVVTANTDPPNGSVVMNPDGSYTYTPDPGFVGQDTFMYTICDDGTPPLCDTATVTIQVLDNQMNTTTAVDDAYITFIDVPITGQNVLANDIDLEGDNQTVDITISPSSGPSNGTLVLNADGSFVYTPNAGYFGQDSFVYSIFDDGTPVATDTATVVISISPFVNTTFAIDDINNTFVNTPVDGNVLTNDFDLEGDTQTVTTTTVTTVQGVVVTIDPVTGAYTYTPPTDYVGEDSFEYTICDDGTVQACDSATVYIEVFPISSNNPPVANADTNTTQVDTPVNGFVLPNDFDPDGDPIVVTANTDPPNGSVVMNPDGSYTYTPDPGFVGQDTFMYTICDDGTPPLCDTATVTIQVLDNQMNTTTAVDDAYITFIDVPITGQNVLANDIDLEGDNQTVDITISPSSGPSNGTLVLNADGSFVYTPNAGYFGQDSFVYSIFDDGTPVATDTATVVISISPFVNTTFAIDDINNTFVNTPVDGNVLTNDFDLEGDTQTVTTTTVTTVQGVVVTIDPVTGAYTYTPPTDYVGEDSFEYTICDDGTVQACDSATVYIEVFPISSNNPPVANADTNTTQVDTPVNGFVLPNDFDPDGDPIVVTANTDPPNGSVVMNPDGSYTYTPDPGFVGQDTFMYTICDDGTPPLCDTATVTIQVLDNQMNTTTAVDDAYITFIDVPITGQNVLANDIDLEGDNQTVDITISPSSGPSNGTLVLNADGSFVYTPNAGYFGQDSFVYSIFDDGTPVATDTATVVISISPFVNTTFAIDDINNTFVNTPVDGNVLTNDFDLEGDTQTVTTTTVTTVQGVVVTIDPVTGAYTYTPPTDYVGEDSFEYTICDDRTPQACDSAVVHLEIVPITVNNDPPVANADTNSTLVNVPINGFVLPNDYDPDGDPIVVTANTQPANGTVVMNPDGSYTYTPDTDFVGEDTFEYTICDDGAPPLCDTAIVTIKVIDTFNITTAVDDAYFTIVDVPVSGNVLDNDTDPTGDTQTVDITISPSGGPVNGTVILNADGSFVYTPNAGYSGPESFVYSIFDDGAPVATDTATVIIIISSFKNDILAIDDINDTFVNLPVSGAVGTNDLNPDGPAGTEVFTLVTGPGNGTLVFNADGTYTYTPNTDYVGQDTFEYQVCDGGNPIACDTATVYIEILPIGSPDNDPPVANADTNTTEVDTPVDGNVLVNDFDPDGDPITVTANTQPANGTVVMNPDGSYTYTPDAGFEGEDTFEYTICDDGTPPLCDTATVTIQVLPDNGNITVANDDAYNGTPGNPITGNVSDNDSDPEGDNQTVNTTPVSGPTNGTVVLNADGSFVYTPTDPTFVGTDQFVYEVCDDGTPQACDQATVYITIGDQGNDILAIDDINDTFVNLPVSGAVGTNDLNPDGPAGTEVFTLVTGPGNGTLVFNADGTYTYTPNTDYVGQDTFEYQVCDGGNPIACDTATVYIEILPIGSPDNDPPVANADTNTTEVDTPVDGNVLVNDFDPDGDPITVTANTQPANGTVVMNPDGSYTYTPDAGFEGEDTFEYTICDDGTPPLCDTATVTIQVLPDNGNITVANDDAYNGTPGNPITGNVSDNDSDPEGDNQTVNTTPVSGPTNGTVVLNADGSFVYTPTDPTFVGTDQFVYEVCDDGTPQACDQATVYITIGDQGNDILAIDDINDTFVNLPVSGAVGTNDLNPDGPAGTEVFTLVTGPGNGTLVFNADGTYTYTPNTDYVGQDTFEYQVCDGGNPIACDTATVYIEILPIGSPDNDPPVANADTNTTEVDTPVDGNVLVNDFDPDGDPITVTANTQPANGTVVMNPDGSYTYTPDAGFEGEDTFEYTICDDGTPPLCDTATVTIQVLPDNGNITVANDDAYNGTPGNPITGNVSDNDSDPEGDNQTVNTTPVSGPTNGTVVLNADGSFVYTPTDPTFVGTDQFVYEVCDDGTPQACDQATVYITIGDQGNDILAIDDINDTFVNLPVSGAVGTNDLNPDGPAGTEVFTLVTGPGNGTLVFNADGTYTYTPNTDYVGQDTFEYQVCDGGNPIACDTATVYIEILPIGSPDNDPPVANADTNTTEVDTPVDGNVLVNDFDPDGDPITVTANTQPANGTVVMNPDGSYTYTPDAGFEGEDTFEYTICDDGTPPLCDTATVTIQVLPDNGNITVANDDAYNGTPGNPITGNVSDNDSDPEGDNQTVNTTPVSGPTNGTVVLNADGSFVYTPTDPTFVGTDQFVYEVCDDGTPQACDQATVYITIGDQGNDILAIDDINDTFVNLPVSGAVGTNDLNPDGPAGTEVFTLVTGPGNGTLVFNADGTYTYTPNTDYVGQDTFEYQVCDGGNPIACDTATVYIEILPIGSPDNDPPVANADTNTTEVDTPVDGNVLVNDFDPDGDPITVTANTQPANGTVVMNPDGSYTYTPDAGFEGEDTFEYTICDDGTPPLCDTATVTIQVLPDNGNITVANDDAYNGTPGNPITGNVSDNDSDPEGDNQTVNTTPVSGPTNGTVVLNADGSFVYTPTDPTFVGTDQFVYEVCDDGTPQACDQATVYITIGDQGNDILAIDDINDTFVNLPVSGAVGTNDLNPDGPAGTEVFTLVTGPGNGTLVFNADGTYTYTPNTDYVGQDTFEYQVCDGGNPIACDTALVTIEIVSDPVIGNDPPIANNDTNVTLSNIPISGNVLPNDFDPDGDPITITGNTNPTNGTVVLNPDGSYTYTPNTGFVGVDTFMYTICDNGTPPLCDDATVVIYVLPLNGNITVANDDAYYGETDTDILGNVLDNDSDPEGNNQMVDIATSPLIGPSNGSVVINGDGTFVYTPNAGFTGTDQFVYEIFDDGTPVATDKATVYILINQTPAPAIDIVKTGVFIDGNNDGCANVGEMIDYTFTVTNTGNVSLSNVVVNDTLLGGPLAGPASGDINGDGILDLTETWIYTASYVLTQIDIDAGVVNNTATVSGISPNGTTVTATSNAVATTLTSCESIEIVKTGVFIDGNNDGCANVGEMIDYTFTVTNTGNVSLSNVVVNDTLLGGPLAGPASGDTNGDGILDLTETWIYTASYVLTQIDIDAGVVNNTATVTGTAPNGTTVTATSNAVATTLTSCESIEIVKTGVFIDGNNDGCANVGEMIDYTFTVTNTGNVSLSNVVVNDTLLGGPLAGPASGDTNGDGILDLTETWIYTASYVLTQIDIDAGVVNNTATVTGTAPNGATVTATSNAVATTLTSCESIEIVKTGVFIDGNNDGCANVGEMIDYTFTVTNTGNVSLSNVVVNDTLLGGPLAGPASGDTNGDGILDLTETWIYTASYVLTQIDIDAGVVNNTATVTGTAPNGATVTATSNAVATTLTSCESIEIVKTGVFIDGNNDGCANVGEMIDYTFTVTNTGNVSLSNVVVNDTLLGGPLAGPASGDTNGDGILDLTETWIYTASYVLTQIDIDAGVVNNTATVTGTAPNGATVTATSNAVATTLTSCESIEIVKTGVFIDGNNDGCANVGEMIDYTFTVTNTGNVSLSNVVVNDTLLGGPLAGPASGDTNGDGILDLTETWIYTASYVLTQIDIDAGVVNNTATVTGTAPNGATVTATSNAVATTLTSCESIEIVKTGVFIDGNNDGCANVGEMIDYTFTVTNTGNVSLSNVVVNDTLLGGPLAGPASGDTNGDGILDLTETWIYTASYVLTQIDIDAGVVNNTATVTGTAPNGATVTATSNAVATTLTSCESIEIVKTGVFIDGNNDGCANVGEMIDYTFTVTNTGNVSLSNVVVNDTLLGGPLAGPASGDTNGDGILDLTETWIYTASYVLTQIDIDAGVVNNTATVTGTAPNGATVTASSNEVATTLTSCGSIALIKFGEVGPDPFNGTGCPRAGDTVEYTFTVVNTGNVELSDVTITDPLPGIVLVGGPITLAAGATDSTSFTATYVLSQADVDAGEIVNQATAFGTTPGGNIVSDLSDDNVITEDDPTVVELCQSPFIGLVKVGTVNDDNGNGCGDVGETISYTFTVHNLGNVTLTNINITDALVDIIGGPLATLAPLDTDATTFSAVYEITPLDTENGFVDNQAIVTGVTLLGTQVQDLSDNNSPFEDDPTMTELCPIVASMSVTKSGVFNNENPANGPQVGETISYVFSVTNTGNVTLYNIIIEDPLPGIVISGGPIEMLPPGMTDNTTFTAVYTLVEDDIPDEGVPGFIMNQATATAQDINGNDVTDDSDDPNNPTDFDNNGDGEPDDPTRTDLGFVGPAEFEIFNGITPDGDGKNDFFLVQGISDFGPNNMQIFNRWGVLVFETDGYGGSNDSENVFRGVSEGRVTIRESKELPTGTYFYILRFFGENPGQDSYSGYLYINR